jgi:hypothetical protein
MMFNYNDLFASLEIMWKGMLGLFIVCGCIMLIIMALSKTIRKKKSE